MSDIHDRVTVEILVDGVPYSDKVFQKGEVVTVGGGVLSPGSWIDKGLARVVAETPSTSPDETRESGDGEKETEETTETETTEETTETTEAEPTAASGYTPPTTGEDALSSVEQEVLAGV